MLITSFENVIISVHILGVLSKYGEIPHEKSSKNGIFRRNIFIFNITPIQKQIVNNLNGGRNVFTTNMELGT